MWIGVYLKISRHLDDRRAYINMGGSGGGGGGSTMLHSSTPCITYIIEMITDQGCRQVLEFRGFPDLLISGSMF